MAFEGHGRCRARPAARARDPRPDWHRAAPTSRASLEIAQVGIYSPSAARPAATAASRASTRAVSVNSASMIATAPRARNQRVRICSWSWTSSGVEVAERVDPPELDLIVPARGRPKRARAAPSTPAVPAPASPAAALLASVLMLIGELGSRQHAQPGSQPRRDLGSCRRARQARRDRRRTMYWRFDEGSAPAAGQILGTTRSGDAVAVRPVGGGLGGSARLGLLAPRAPGAGRRAHSRPNCAG